MGPTLSTPRREQASDKRGAQRSATSPSSDKPQGYTEGSGACAPGGRPPGKGPPGGNGDDGDDDHHEDDDDDEYDSDSFEELLKEEEKYLDKDQTKLKLGPDQTTVMIGKKMYIVQPATVEHKVRCSRWWHYANTWNGKCRRRRSTTPSWLFRPCPRCYRSKR